MLTLLAVFKDLLPAYRIRPVVDEEEAGKARNRLRPKIERDLFLCYRLFSDTCAQFANLHCFVQLSKDVRALKVYEKALLDGYHTYLQALQQVSMRCLCSMDLAYNHTSRCSVYQYTRMTLCCLQCTKPQDALPTTDTQAQQLWAGTTAARPRCHQMHGWPASGCSTLQLQIR